MFPQDLQAWGNNFAATVVIIAGTLVWHILHPPHGGQRLARRRRRAKTGSIATPAQGKATWPTPRPRTFSIASMPISTTACERLFALLRIKSISADPAFAGDCKAAADHLAKDFASLGFEAEVRPTAGHPAIVAKSNGKATAARPHVLFYGHYDVQPVDPLNLWHRPPFEPVVTDHADGRKIIVARGAEDDKGQLMTFVEACRAWKSVTGSLPLDVTMLIEGEEEVGSKNFVPFLEANKDELKADYALVCDTGMWDPNTPAITTSLRGLVYEEVKIKAASRDLHSGVFGGGARNPIRVLTHILGGLFDENGHITIPGFYDGVKDLPPEVLAQWKKLNLTPETFLKPIGLSIPAGEKDRLLIEQVSSRPTCDINGIVGGYIGEGSKTVIPAEASAKISFRLVEGQDPAKIRKAFRDYVTARHPRRLQGRVRRPFRRRPRSRCPGT